MYEFRRDNSDSEKKPYTGLGSFRFPFKAHKLSIAIVYGLSFFLLKNIKKYNIIYIENEIEGWYV